MSTDLSSRLQQAIRDVPDFPKPGILFRDVTTLFLRPDLVSEAVDALWNEFATRPVSHIVAIEARGFVIGADLALRHRLPLVLLRKPGKLPAESFEESYELEYGRATLQIHSDAIGVGDQALIVDDLLATGGTAAAAGKLIRRCGASVAGYGFFVELDFLGGRGKLADAPVASLLHYMAEE
jgi:adenine phosphoribosyltransferase